MVPLSKSGLRKQRGFESHPLRQARTCGRPVPALAPPRSRNAPTATLMTEAKRIAREDVPLQPGKVVDEGGELRVLQGGDHGLHVSLMESRIMPGSGPLRHRHPHAEIFVIVDGNGRFEVDGEQIEAEPGDVLIIPPNAWHRFVNQAAESLRLVAIHENARALTEFEDGTRRD